MSAAVGDRTAGGAESAEGPATLGQWLDARIPRLNAGADRADALTGSGETRRVVDALERLARRVEAQERRSAMGAAAVDRALDDVANRVGSIEDVQTETSGRLFDALLGLERVHGGLADRLAALEVDGVRHKAFARLEDRASALETHLAQARTLTGREIEGLREGMSRLGQAAQESIEDLTQRVENARYAPVESVEALQSEAALLRKTLSSFQAETNARLHGLATDSSTADELKALRSQFLVSSERLDSALARVTGRMEALAANAVPRAELEESARVVSAALAAMAARLDGQDLAFGRTKDELDQVLGGVSARLTDLSARVETAQNLIAEEVVTAANQRENLESVLSDVRARLEASAARAEAVSEAARAAANERCDAIARITEDRIDQAAARSAIALSTLEDAQGALEARVRELGEARLAQETARLQEEFAARSDALTDEMQAAIRIARQEFERRLEQTAAAIETGALATGLSEALNRITHFGKSQEALGETVSIELKRWNESQDRRLRGVEARLDDSVSATGRLEARFASLESDSLGAASHTHEALSALSARIEERASAGERRAGQALEQVGTQIIELADRMDHRQRLLLQDLEARLADFERRSEAAAQERQAVLESKFADSQARFGPPAEIRQPESPIPAQGILRGLPESIPAPKIATEEGDFSDFEDEDIPAPAFLARDHDVHLEDHFIDDYAEAPVPRYDLVDALDAAISRDSSRRQAPTPVADPIEALLAPVETAQERRATLVQAKAASDGAGAPVFAPAIQPAPEPAPEPLDPVDVLLANAGNASGAPLVLGPHDSDAITLTGAMRVERAPSVPVNSTDDLFNSPLADAATQSRTAREPSYLAAARRAAQVSADQATVQRSKSNGPTLTRALFWAATAVAVGAGVYAVSRESGSKASKPALKHAGNRDLHDAQSTRAAAQRTLAGAAQHIAFSEDFQAQPVDLPEEGAEPLTVPITPSTSATPLAQPHAATSQDPETGA